LEAAAKVLVDTILSELGEGNNVCIENFGTFSVSARAIRPAHEQHDIRSESVKFKKIVFKTSMALSKHHTFTFERLPK